MNDLFYNLPARRKFLKSDAAESAQVSRVTTQLALANPEIGFTLTSGGRKVLQCPPAANLRDRLYQLYGERDDLLLVRKEAGGLRISGYVASLAEQGPTRGPQHVFVNRRIVKDRTIAHAIIDAYSVASIKERSPEVHLFIEMPPDTVDVNVHPDQGRSPFPRAVAGARSRSSRADGCAGAGRGAAPAAAGRSRRRRRPLAQALPGVLGGGIFPSRWRPGDSDLRPPHGGRSAATQCPASARTASAGPAAATLRQSAR